MNVRRILWLCVLFAALSGLGATQSRSLFRLQPLAHEHRHSPTSQKYLIETMGGGGALLDYDNDGRLDVFTVNGGTIADPVKLPANFRRDAPENWNRLYRQNADGTFTDVTAKAGLSGSANVYGMGVATGDFDNDGFTDIFVTGYAATSLYRNRGDGTFADVTAAAHANVAGWSASAGFFDYDNDGRLDLFVTRYLEWDIAKNILCGTPFHAYCRPDRFPAVASVLLHNEGGGRFRDESESTGIATIKGKALGVAFNDYDNDGFTDIFVANDGMEQFLFHNEGGKLFREMAVEAGVAFADDGKTFAGMGVAFEDFNGDGRADILVTNLALEKYALYRNGSAGQFRYASLATGLAALTSRNSGWGVALADFDNDGRRDIFVAQSHVLDNVERMNSGLRYLEPPALLRFNGSRYEAQPFDAPAKAWRGAAFGDINNDGTIDVVLTALGEQPIVLLNRMAPRRWLSLALEGARSNRDGIGAIVQAAGQVAHVSTAGSYLSASDKRAHFGLGDQTTVTVEVRWPSGVRQKLENVATNQVLQVREPR